MPVIKDTDTIKYRNTCQSNFSGLTIKLTAIIELKYPAKKVKNKHKQVFKIII